MRRGESGASLARDPGSLGASSDFAANLAA